jgi:hypothetical protein
MSHLALSSDCSIGELSKHIGDITRPIQREERLGAHEKQAKSTSDKLYYVYFSEDETQCIAP